MLFSIQRNACRLSRGKWSKPWVILYPWHVSFTDTWFYRHLNKEIGTEEKSEEAKPGNTSEYKARLRRQSILKVHHVIDGTLLIANWKAPFYLMKINTGTNKNQAQSRKFNIAQLTRNVSTPVFRGSVRKLCAHLFTRVFELLHERKCLNFHEMLSKKTHL